MINTPGNKVIIVDSDALIGLINPADFLHQRCQKVLLYLQKNKYNLFTPYPIVLEAATALARNKKINRPDLAARILKNYHSNNQYQLITEVGKIVAELYNPKTSVKNTPFDHYLLALAKRNHIKFVFSFDSFYQKHGLTLIERVVNLSSPPQKSP